MSKLVIRPDIGRVAIVFLAIAAFIVVGLAMMILPPHTDSIIPFNYFVQAFIGFIGCAFGFVALGALLWRIRKPIIVVDDESIHYYRNGATVPWHDIISAKAVKEWGEQKVRWLYIYVAEPDKYRHFEKMSKRVNWIDGAALVFDFGLASQTDYEKACRFIIDRVNQS